jgi:hypothetical protein
MHVLEQACMQASVLPEVHAGKERVVQGLQLHEHAGWKFWRFDVSAELGEQPRCLQYSLAMDGVDQNHRCLLPFFPPKQPEYNVLSMHAAAEVTLIMSGRYPVALPAAQQGWHWGFHSCNGLSSDVTDVAKWKNPHLWEDVMAVSCPPIPV